MFVWPLLPWWSYLIFALFISEGFLFISRHTHTRGTQAGESTLAGTTRLQQVSLGIGTVVCPEGYTHTLWGLLQENRRTVSKAVNAIVPPFRGSVCAVVLRTTVNNRAKEEQMGAFLRFHQKNTLLGQNENNTHTHWRQLFSLLLIISWTNHTCKHTRILALFSTR